MANIKSEYPKLIEIFKKAELPEIIAQHIPHGFSDEQIIIVLDHLFDIAIEKGRSADKNLLKIFGGHVNFGGLIQDSEVLQFLEPTTPNAIDGFYNKTVAIKTPLGKFYSYKTYFPSDWAPEQIVKCIIRNLKKAEFNDLAATKNINFKAKIYEGLFLEYFFNVETKIIDSIFPTFK